MQLQVQHCTICWMGVFLQGCSAATCKIQLSTCIISTMLHTHMPVLQAVEQQADELEQLISESAADLGQLHNRKQAILGLMDKFGTSRPPQQGATEGASCHPGEQDTSAEDCLQTDGHRDEQHCQDIAPQPSLGSKHQGSTQQFSPGSEALCDPKEPLAGGDAGGSDEDAAAWSFFAQVRPNQISSLCQAPCLALCQALY